MERDVGISHIGIWVKSTPGAKNDKDKGFKPGVCLKHLRTTGMPGYVAGWNPMRQEGVWKGPRAQTLLGIGKRE